jgi:hypothetical protein
MRPDSFTIRLRFKQLACVVHNPLTNLNTIVNYWAIYDSNDRYGLLIKILFNNCDVTYRTITIGNIPTSCIVFRNSNFAGFHF